jgi:hypothetical protein
MSQFSRLWTALRKRLVLGLIVTVLACGARVGWDAARIWVVGTPASIPLAAKRAAAMDSARAKAMVEPLVLDGAAPLERQLPSELRSRIRPEIESWVLAWRVPRPNFRLDQLALTGTRALSDGGLEIFDGNAEGQDLRLLYLCLPGMDPSKLADPYLDLQLTQSGGRVVARRVGDPGVELIDLEHKTKRRALNAPPFGRFDGAYWIDATHLLVLASERIEENPFGGGPVLYVIDVRDETVTRYAGPSVPYAEFVGVRSELDRRLRLGNREIDFASI